MDTLSDMEKPPLTERIWDYVTRGTERECWLWQGYFLQALPAISVLKIDFEQINLEKRFGSILAGPNRWIPAARVLWGLTRGNVPIDKMVVNSCGNTSCVNPYHHELGLYQDIADVRMENSRTSRGEKSHSAKITNELAKSIYDEYHAGEATQVELADRYGLTIHAVRSLCIGRTWNSVTGAAQKTWSRDSARRNVRAKNPRNRFIEKP